MKTYTLQATTSTTAQAVPIEAIDDESAMLQAIDQILGRAITSPVWARGLITLTDPDGIVIQTMDAKPDSITTLKEAKSFFKDHIKIISVN
jgi:hypothetical protein